MRQGDVIILTGLKVRCIIGIFDWERRQKQDVVLDMRFPCDTRKASRTDDIRGTVDYKAIAKASIAFVEKSRYGLIETLAEKLASELIARFQITELFLRVSKPGAVRGSQNVGVEITRHGPPKTGLAFFSLGSNLSPLAHLPAALREMEDRYGLSAISHVYRTSAVGPRRQPDFLNMVVGMPAVEKPKALKSWARELERRWGRVRSKDKFAPRTLDLDLIDYPSKPDRALKLPHPDIPRKAFVLFPFLEIAPTWSHPVTGLPLTGMAWAFRDKSQLIHRLPPDTLSAFPPRP